MQSIHRLRQARRLLNHYEDFLYKLSLSGKNSNTGVSLEEMRRSWYSVARQVKSIQGWVPDTAGMGLYQLARFGNHNGTVVELGSWKGRSTVWLASGIRDRGQGYVHAVDTWKGSTNESVHEELLKGYSDTQLYDEFTNNLKNRALFQYVTATIADTAAAAKLWSPDREIGLLFIDASHEYEGVRDDIAAWTPYVQSGGYIVFDDIPSWEGPTRALNEIKNGYSFVGTFTDQYVLRKQ